MIDEQTLRESLERRAGSIPAVPGDPDRAVHLARRRLGFTWGFAVAVAVVLVVAGVAGVRAFSSEAPRPATHTPTPPAAGLRHNGLIFLSDGSVIDPATGAYAPVATLPSKFLSDAVNLAWSPDGTRLAVAKDRGNTTKGTKGLYIVDWASRRTRLLVPCAEHGQCPDGFAWSPDGTRLVYALSSELRLIGSDGTGSTTIPVGNLRVLDVTWSPDGTRFAFSARSNGSVGLYVVPLGGGAPIRIGDGGFRPTWSPDGSRIAYLTVAGFRHRAGRRWPQYGLATIRPDGSDEATVFLGGSCYCTGISPSFTWSPDGTEIAAFLPQPARWERFGLYVLRSDGSRPRRILSNSVGGFRSMSWRPIT